MVFFQIAGGIALTVFGVRFLRKGFERLFGGHLVAWLAGLTERRWKAWGAGVVVGTLAPSSTAISLVTMQMMNAGQFTAERMFALLLGANAGITVTVQLMAFRLQDWAGTFLLAGVLGFQFLKRETLRGIGQCLLALGLVFLAMGLIGKGAAAITLPPAPTSSTSWIASAGSTATSHPSATPSAPKCRGTEHAQPRIPQACHRAVPGCLKKTLTGRREKNIFSPMRSWPPAAALLFLLPATSCFAEVLWPSPNQPDSSTLALFHFDETGPKAIDGSQRGYELQLGNESSRSPDAPQWIANPEGKYLTPAGDSESGTTGITENLNITDVDFNQGLTVSFWYQPRAGEEQSGELFQIEGPRVRVTTDDFGAGANGRIRLVAPGCTEDSPPILADSGAEPRWRHVAVVYDPLDSSASNGGKWALFLDGTEVGASEDPEDLSQDTNLQVRIGGNIWNNGPLQGVDLDEFLITNKVITDFANPSR